jgi:hypothetical protein
VSSFTCFRINLIDKIRPMGDKVFLDVSESAILRDHQKFSLPEVGCACPQYVEDVDMLPLS